jgi:hypothetical protein
MPKGGTVLRRGNPLQGESQERYRRERKPNGFREEQGVKGPRKPEDAAQPGQASPVQVASRYLMRCRDDEPQESKPRERRFPPGHTLKQSRVHGRIWASIQTEAHPAGFREDLEGQPARAKVREGSSTHGTIPVGRQDSEGRVNCTRGGVVAATRRTQLGWTSRALEGNNVLSRVKKLIFISLRREEIQPGLEKNGTARFRL